MPIQIWVTYKYPKSFSVLKGFNVLKRLVYILKRLFKPILITLREIPSNNMMVIMIIIAS